MLLANPQALGLLSHPKWHLAVLLAYADGLMADQQYERAVVSVWGGTGDGRRGGMYLRLGILLFTVRILADLKIVDLVAINFSDFEIACSIYAKI